VRREARRAAWQAHRRPRQRGPGWPSPQVRDPLSPGAPFMRSHRTGGKASAEPNPCQAPRSGGNPINSTNQACYSLKSVENSWHSRYAPLGRIKVAEKSKRLGDPPRPFFFADNGIDNPFVSLILAVTLMIGNFYRGVLPVSEPLIQLTPRIPLGGGGGVSTISIDFRCALSISRGDAFPANPAWRMLANPAWRMLPP